MPYGLTISSDLGPRKKSDSRLKNPLFAPMSSGFSIVLENDILAGSGGGGHMSCLCGVCSSSLTVEGAQPATNERKNKATATAAPSLKESPARAPKGALNDRRKVFRITHL